MRRDKKVEMRLCKFPGMFAVAVAGEARKRAHHVGSERVSSRSYFCCIGVNELVSVVALVDAVVRVVDYAGVAVLIKFDVDVLFAL